MIDTYVPLGDYILVSAEFEDEKTSKSKIILTNSIERGDVVTSTVLATGPGIYTQNGELIPMNVKVGNEVMYRKDMNGLKIKIDSADYILFHEHELLMINRNN